MKKLLLALFIVGICSLISSDIIKAQIEASPLVIIKTTTEDAQTLMRSKPHGPKEIPVPNFVIKTKNNKFMLAIGGFINPIMGADINRDLYETAAGISFIPGDIPLTKEKGKNSDYYINPINGALDLHIVGLAGTKNEITAYFKIVTNGITPWLGYSRAYMTWRGFTFGQKLTMMQDLYACQPPTIDPQGPCGDISTVVYEVSYQSPSYNGFRYSIGLDLPTFYSSTGLYRGKDYPAYQGEEVFRAANPMIPDVPMWIEYQKSAQNRIRLSALLRNFQYVDLVDNKERDLFGWGTMLSGNFSFWKPLTFYCQAAYGKGIGNYLQDIAGRPISYIPRDDRPGKMKAAPMMGLVFGASYNITPKWQINAIASESKIWETGTYYADYKYTLYMCGNIFYNITPYLQWGLEYLWGKHASWDHTHGINNRVQSQLMFTF